MSILPSNRGISKLTYTMKGAIPFKWLQVHLSLLVFVGVSGWDNPTSHSFVTLGIPLATTWYDLLLCHLSFRMPCENTWIEGGDIHHTYLSQGLTTYTLTPRGICTVWYRYSWLLGLKIDVISTTTYLFFYHSILPFHLVTTPFIVSSWDIWWKCHLEIAR